MNCAQCSRELDSLDAHYPHGDRCGFESCWPTPSRRSWCDCDEPVVCQDCCPDCGEGWAALAQEEARRMRQAIDPDRH